MQRRQFLNTGSSATVLGLLMSSGLLPRMAQAQIQNAPGWNKAAFETKSLNDAVKAMGGSPPALSQDVIVNTPEIAENGNVVRVSFESKLPGTTAMALLIEKNPNVLSALYEVPQGTLPTFTVHVKMGQSTNVYAVAKVGDRFFYNVKETKVTLGGCGG